MFRAATLGFLLSCAVAGLDLRASQASRALCDTWPLLWFFSHDAFGRLRAVDPTLAAGPLNSPRTSVVVDRGRSLAASAAARGLSVSGRHQYRALAELNADIVEGRITGDVATIMYNPEVWKETPETEQSDPVRAVREFAAVVHALGKTALVIPSCGLLRKMPVGGRDIPNERCVDLLLVQLAPFADVLDFELQDYERDCVAYGHMAQYAANTLKAVNPHLKVIVQLSTDQRFHTTADQLLHCAKSASPWVDGFFLYVGSGSKEAPMAAQFLRHLYGNPKTE
jgi:hypothetical protein